MFSMIKITAFSIYFYSATTGFFYNPPTDYTFVNMEFCTNGIKQLTKTDEEFQKLLTEYKPVCRREEITLVYRKDRH